MKSAEKKILVMRYRFIGDTILTVPFLRNLRRAEPDARISWMVAPGSSEIIKDIPYVDSLVYWDPATIHADSSGTHRTLSSKLAFIKNLRKERFDKVYVLKRSLSSAVIAWLSGAPERIGFDTEGRGLLLTKRVAYRHDCHEVKNFLAVLAEDGIRVEDDFLEIWTKPEEDRKASDLLSGSGIGLTERVVVIHPFSAVVERGWPLEKFAELSVKLTTKTACRIVVVGGKRDRKAFAEVRHLFGPAIIDFVGACSLRETAALLKRASLFVGNDSGVMHLAAAAGVPVVALFGPQSPVKFGPWSSRAKVIYKGMQCSPCRQKFFTECAPSARMRPACMERITVEEVFQESVTLSGLRWNKESVF